MMDSIFLINRKLVPRVFNGGHLTDKQYEDVGGMKAGKNRSRVKTKKYPDCTGLGLDLDNCLLNKWRKVHTTLCVQRYRLGSLHWPDCP